MEETTESSRQECIFSGNRIRLRYSQLRRPQAPDAHRDFDELSEGGHQGPPAAIADAFRAAGPCAGRWTQSGVAQCGGCVERADTSAHFDEEHLWEGGELRAHIEDTRGAPADYEPERSEALVR